MKFDRYTLFARLFPAMLSSLPVFVLSHYFLIPIMPDLLNDLNNFKWIIGDISITMAAIFMLMELNRWISKSMLEGKLFVGGTNLPTTRHLLWFHTPHSHDYLMLIHKKINEDFSIALCSKEEEQMDEREARKRIGSVIGLIISKVSTGRLTGERNIEYGFARNLAGGAVVGLILSLGNIILFGLFSYNYIPFIASIVMATLYSMYLLAANKIILSLGENYAFMLIREYMTEVRS